MLDSLWDDYVKHIDKSILGFKYAVVGFAAVYVIKHVLGG